MPHTFSVRRAPLAALALLAALSALACGAAAVPRRPRAGVLRATLDNGLRVVIVRNSLAPVVATSVNYLAGSDEAPAGFPGTAHAMEHMMFRGSPGLTADQLADIGSIVGGDFNANTREDLTQYLFTVPAEDLDIALNIEALRMRAVLATPKEWEHERGAIEQEVAQDLSEPGYKLFARLRERMFAGTPYAHDALGTRPSFDKTTAQMLKSFHDTWYAPNNAILVIAGNVDPEATLSEVKRLFGAIPAKKLPARPRVQLRPVQPISFTVDTDQPAGTLMLATRTPGPRDADYPALEVLADVLSSKRFALYGLVPQGKATGAEFALDPLARGRPRLRGAVLQCRRRCQGPRGAGARHPRRAWRATGCPRSWWPPPSCRSAVKRSSSATRSRSWPRSGRTRWRCTASIPRTRTWRASRR